jgi:DNA topoisomerase VI subunit B
MDFFSERELVTQTGHPVDEWPLVIVKELIDNALDACEEADVVPVIEVAADAGGITVRDNGPGLPEATLRGALDFKVRVSNREAYVSPCRGAQGNALKTLLPMPYVVDPENGKFIVEAHGRRHAIRCGIDPISQRPVIRDEDGPAKSKNGRPGRGKKKQAFSGTEVRLEWGARIEPDGAIVWPFGDFLPLDDPIGPQLCALVEGFAVFNPHATITLDWFGAVTTWEATDPAWVKWKPYQPTSAHWYEVRHLERLIGAYITHEREAGADRLVSELLAEFDGLSGSAKRTKVLAEAGLKRVRLSEFVVDDRLDSERIARLLAAMRAHTRPVRPKRLGLIGEEHLKARLLAMGIKPESFRYSKKLGGAEVGEVPGVLESAFGCFGGDAPNVRKIYSGANWSAAIRNPFRSFGETGEGLETVLADMRATRNEPIVYVLHLAQPRVEYTDRGKSALVLGT